MSLTEQNDAEIEDAVVGTTLGGRYKIEKSLDRGGMGTVYLATDTKLSRDVVVKIPHASKMTDPKFRDRFLREIRDLSTHEHPAILSIIDSGSHEDIPYAVVQYLAGGNLREKITSQGGQQTRDEILEWLPTIANALDTVHGNGSLHRDVKPANILFDGQANAILSDFGIATAIGAADPDAPTEEVGSELTAVGGFIGSPSFMPPEAVDRILTPSYDQYSLATVVYYALTGDVPFTGATHEAILINKATHKPAPINRARLKGNLPRAAEKAIMKALSTSPEDRFGSCTEFAEAFSKEGSAEALALPPKQVLAGIAAAVLVGVIGFGFDWGQIDWPQMGAGDAEVSDSPWPVTVQLGSTGPEIDRAVFLCERGGGNATNCAREVFADERLRTVTLAAYTLDETEVTNEAFARFVEATGHETTAEERGYSWDVTRCRNCTWKAIRPGKRMASDHPADPVVHV